MNRRQTIASTTRRYIAICRLDNAFQQGRVNLASATREMRNRLVSDMPHAAPAEIEKRLARIMARLMQPTATTPPTGAPEGIPKAVLDARRAERKRASRQARKERK